MFRGWTAAWLRLGPNVRCLEIALLLACMFGRSSANRFPPTAFQTVAVFMILEQVSFVVPSVARTRTIEC